MCCFFLGVTDVTNLLHNFAHFCFCTGWRRLIECLKLQVVFRKKATNHRALLHKMTHQDKASYDSTPPCIRICGIGSWITKIPSRTNPKEWVTFVIWMSHGISHRASDGTWLGLRCHMTASDVTWGKRMNVSHIWCRSRAANVCTKMGTTLYPNATWEWVCCSVLQCVAVCCTVLQWDSVSCSVLQYQNTTYEWVSFGRTSHVSDEAVMSLIKESSL